MPPVRALIAATSYPRDASDWKGRFIFDQVAAVARQGIDVSLWAPPGELPEGVRSALSKSDADFLSTLMERGGIAHLLRMGMVPGAIAGARLLARWRSACRRSPADLYHVNWLQNALGLPDDGRPALVTVLGSDFGLLRVPGMALALRRQFSRRRTVLAPNANWMVERLKEIFGDVATIEPNPFGVAAEWFATERFPAGERQGWLLVSRLTRGKLGTVIEWGEGLFSAQRPLHLLGPMQEDIPLPTWVHHHGATNPQALREQWFPKVAGLLTLSRHDEGRPQVLVEAMAAGLPVIASCIPAHQDLIRHGETGWLAANRAEFEHALAEAENAVAAQQVGTAARAWVRSSVGTWDDCARRYVEAYRRLENCDE